MEGFLNISNHSLAITSIYNYEKPFALPQGDASWKFIVEDGDTILEDAGSRNLDILSLCN